MQELEFDLEPETHIGPGTHASRHTVVEEDDRVTPQRYRLLCPVIHVPHHPAPNIPHRLLHPPRTRQTRPDAVQLGRSPVLPLRQQPPRKLDLRAHFRTEIRRQRRQMPPHPPGQLGELGDRVQCGTGGSGRAGCAFVRQSGTAGRPVRRLGLRFRPRIRQLLVPAGNRLCGSLA